MNKLPRLEDDQIIQVLAGSIAIDNKPKVLQILGLGSCIALSFYYPKKNFGALAHVMLPSSVQARTPALKGKYADTAVDELVRLFQRKKISLSDIQIKIVGGAKMFMKLTSEVFDISNRNIQAIKNKLNQYNLKIQAQDIGGKRGRTIYFFLENGEIRVYYAGGKLKAIV
ncbi:MAG: chemotaxis protein CheD [Candidatus Hodarchaeales archaeon]